MTVLTKLEGSLNSDATHIYFKIQLFLIWDSSRILSSTLHAVAKTVDLFIVLIQLIPASLRFFLSLHLEI